MNKAILTCEQMSKSYHDGNQLIEVLKEVALSIHEGDRIAIVGPSGSGKSTLLHLLGGLDIPSKGTVHLKGKNWQALKERARCKLRNTELGFIYQFHHLLPEFTALENTAMPLLLRGLAVEKAKQDAKVILEEVGLGKRLEHKPSELSGGERQRTAIARALVHKPKCMLADEPTGNLDQATALKVFEQMLELNKQCQTALVIVTHDLSLANRMDKVWHLQEGQLKNLPPSSE